MKNILTKITVIVALSGWTFFALASPGSHDMKCKHEWTAGFNDAKLANQNGQEEDEESSVSKPSIESFLPGNLQNLILQ